MGEDDEFEPLPDKDPSKMLLKKRQSTLLYSRMHESVNMTINDDEEEALLQNSISIRSKSGISKNLRHLTFYRAKTDATV